MIERTISRKDARQVYDALGMGLDRMERFEAQAKALSLQMLGLSVGQRVLHVGVGTGAEHEAIENTVKPGGDVVGYDLSREMLLLTRKRADTPFCQGDTGALPFKSNSFDRLFSAYTLDLLPAADLPIVIREFRRVLRPGGRLVLISLTEGVDVASRAFVAGWKLLFRLAPQRLGGCRPLQLLPLLQQAGFVAEREVMVQRGFPSEVLIGILPE
jgi:demethylmenaquinone methyltransferase/2-methoxy-6-polyprenyl-1,4-benzoquinol methylase